MASQNEVGAAFGPCAVEETPASQPHGLDGPQPPEESALAGVLLVGPAEPQVSAGLSALRPLAYDDEQRTVTVRLGGREVVAALDPSVSPVVVRTAIARGERLIVEREEGRLVVLGSLRTAPVPGLDEADEYVLRARRISIEAADEVSLKTGSASFVLRARGYIESLAQNITARAASVHKIIGRMIHLN